MSDMPMPSWRAQPETPAVSRRMLLVAGGLLGGVVLLGLVGWGVSKVGPRAVPIVEPEPTPIKERPADPGGLVIPNQDESIFDRPGERRAEQALVPNRVAPGPEAPQIERLRQQQLMASQGLRREQPAVQAPPQQTQPQQTQPQEAPVANPRSAAPPPHMAATPAPVVPVATTGGRWQIQLGALNSEASARTAWERAAHQVPALGSRQPSFTKLERDGQPTLWRVRTGGLADAAAARALCDAVKAKGGSCMPVPP
jgi:cell division septation protein DedD